MQNIQQNQQDNRLEIAVLGGGCFWCLEAVYQQLKGVQQVESGYAGGHVKHPTYEQVCQGDTGHAEVIKLTFDPQVIGFREILEVFFTMHDPTTLNRQGNDSGTQYRSVIYYHSLAQQKLAQHIIAEMALVWDAPVVTELSPVGTYYKAEDEHQNYFQQHPFQGYCALVVAPKLAKFREVFAENSKNE